MAIISDTSEGVAAERQLLLRGIRDTLPLLPGTVPFGLIYGATAVAAHVPMWLAQAMSFIIFAGSSQFAVVLLVSSGASAVILVLTAATLNLRHLLYSVSLGPTLRGAPRGWRLILAYLMTDETYGVVVGKMLTLPMRQRIRYMFGSGLTLWGSWQLGTLMGILIGARIPASWSLDFAATLTFIALLVPLLRDRAMIGAALAAAVVSALALGAPLKLGLALAAIAGIAVGVLLDHMSKGRAQSAKPAKPAKPDHPDLAAPSVATAEGE